MDLFSPAVDPVSNAPLAHRLRPESLSEFMGQERLLAPGAPLRGWIERDQLPSMILWGPPGSGKTSLANIIAKTTKMKFETMSAVESGVATIKKAAESAKLRRVSQGLQTLLFVDEIHRFNKGQQDTLLPHIEDGTFVLIGATTENPSFELNRALLSRVKVLKLSPHSNETLIKILSRALQFGGVPFSPEAEAWLLQKLAETSEGDARSALSRLEVLTEFLKAQSRTEFVTIEELKTLLETESALMDRPPLPYDKAGEEHHNVVSAFIKSMRKGDPDAAVYYLARMMEGGEDPLFIARRMVIFASEDVGLGDFRALLVANAAKEAAEFVGWPECRINLAHAAIVLAQSKKDRSAYNAINAAVEEVQATGALPVPNSLRNIKGADNPVGEKDAPNLPKGVRRRRFLGETQ